MAEVILFFPFFVLFSKGGVMSQYLSLDWSKKAFIVGFARVVCRMFFQILPCRIQFVQTICLPKYFHYIFAEFGFYFFFSWAVGLGKRMASFSALHIIASWSMNPTLFKRFSIMNVFMLLTAHLCNFRYKWC